MKMTVDANMALEMFRSWDCDYFTYEALETLLNYYDEIDPNIEFDVIAICCEWDEYGDTPCLTWKDFLSDYDYILKDIDGAEELPEDEKIEAIIDELENRTTVIKLRDSVLVGAF